MCALILRELYQIFTACLFKGKSKTILFPSNTLIYGISRDGFKNFNLRTWEHMILGQLRIGARSTTYAALGGTVQKSTVSRIGTLGIIIFYIFEPPAVQKYSICWVFH